MDCKLRKQIMFPLLMCSTHRYLLTLKGKPKLQQKRNNLNLKENPTLLLGFHLWNAENKTRKG